MCDKCRYAFTVVALLIFSLSASATMAARVQIFSYHGGQVGHPATITVSVDSLDFEISGFNLLIAVDQSSYAVTSVTPGQFFEDCSWEYFTYRIIHDSAQYYNLGDYTDLLNIVALASVSSGFNPSCYSGGTTYNLAQVECLLGLPIPGRPLECEWLPIRFYWRDCDDNVLYSRDNDTVYTAVELFEYGFPDPDPVTYPFPGFGIPDPPCPDPPGQAVVSSLAFQNGGIDVCCLPNSLKGDVNLNGIHYEMADLVLFVNYFTWGLIVFITQPDWQLDQCDINFDGMVTVGDLVLLIRIVVGDIPPILGPYKIASQATASLTWSAGKTRLTLDAGEDVGAVYLRFVSDDGRVLNSSDVTFFGPDFTVGNIGDTTTMLLVDTEGQPALEGGSLLILELPDNDARLVEIQVADMNGNPFKLDYNEATLPRGFSLLQNYPNPFNPVTTISFSLPVKAEWSLSIYNVAGQLVREFNGCNNGEVEVLWDGRDSHANDVASGVYFYRLECGENIAVRKMMLLK